MCVYVCFCGLSRRFMKRKDRLNLCVAACQEVLAFSFACVCVCVGPNLAFSLSQFLFIYFYLCLDVWVSVCMCVCLCACFLMSECVSLFSLSVCLNLYMCVRVRVCSYAVWWSICGQCVSLPLSLFLSFLQVCVWVFCINLMEVALGN